MLWRGGLRVRDSRANCERGYHALEIGGNEARNATTNINVVLVGLGLRQLGGALPYSPASRLRSAGDLSRARKPYRSPTTTQPNIPKAPRSRSEASEVARMNLEPLEASDFFLGTL